MTSGDEDTTVLIIFAMPVNQATIDSHRVWPSKGSNDHRSFPVSASRAKTLIWVRCRKERLQLSEGCTGSEIVFWDLWLPNGSARPQPDAARSVGGWWCLGCIVHWWDPRHKRPIGSRCLVEKIRTPNQTIRPGRMRMRQLDLERRLPVFGDSGVLELAACGQYKTSA